MFRPTVIALALLTGNALAAPLVIDFEGLAAGSSPGNAYADYGIQFDGGTVVHGANGAYVQGNFIMTFAPRSDLQRIAFQATRWDIDGGYVWAYTPTKATPAWVQGTANPKCINLTPEECLRLGYLYIPPEQMSNYTFAPDFMSQVYKVAMYTDLADNITFYAPSWQAPSVVTAEVPEPTTLALMLLSAVGLIRRYWA